MCRGTSESAEAWLGGACEGRLEEIAKESIQTRCWFARLDGHAVFAKWYPTAVLDTWGAVESKIAGSNLHSAIIPLMNRIRCGDGDIFLYPRIDGENLGDREAFRRFGRLPTWDRAKAVLATCGALASVCEAGFTVVDWYLGNMLYDHIAKRVWLFDWELCAPGASLILQAEQNFGSSKLMAPEEFVEGSRIDERTLVFNLGRFALLILPELTEVLGDTLAQATHPRPNSRTESVRALRAGLEERLAAAGFSG